MSTDRPWQGDRPGDRGEGEVVAGELAMRVVEYPDAPDRCTVYPAGLADHERMTHWISADRDVFRSLDRWR